MAGSLVVENSLGLLAACAQQPSRRLNQIQTIGPHNNLDRPNTDATLVASFRIAHEAQAIAPVS